MKAHDELLFQGGPGNDEGGPSLTGLIGVQRNLMHDRWRYRGSRGTAGTRSHALIEPNLSLWAERHLLPAGNLGFIITS